MRWTKGDFWDCCFDQDDVLVGTVMNIESPHRYFWQNFTNGGAKGYNDDKREAMRLAEGK